MKPWGLADGKHGYQYCKCRYCNNRDYQNPDRDRERRVAAQEVEAGLEDMAAGFIDHGRCPECMDTWNPEKAFRSPCGELSCGCHASGCEECQAVVEFDEYLKEERRARLSVRED